MKCVKTAVRGKSATPSYRALAKSLRRSPSHIFRVMQGERKPSAELERKMRRLGLTAGQMKEGK